MSTTLPVGSEERKNIPMATGLLDYFPAALAEVARLSKAANDKHNPGEDMHWSRGKSSDHADTILRHLAERGIVDTDGFYHDVKVAWRALAQLQELLEEKEGAPLSRASRKPEKVDWQDRNEVAYLVATQLKAEGYDLKLASTFENARTKELWALYSGKTNAAPRKP